MYLDVGIQEVHEHHLHDYCGMQIQDPLQGMASQQDEM
jgi:hypothetical protein